MSVCWTTAFLDSWLGSTSSRRLTSCLASVSFSLASTSQWAAASSDLLLALAGLPSWERPIQSRAPVSPCTRGDYKTCKYDSLQCCFRRNKIFNKKMTNGNIKVYLRSPCRWPPLSARSHLRGGSPGGRPGRCRWGCRGAPAATSREPPTSPQSGTGTATRRGIIASRDGG